MRAGGAADELKDKQGLAISKTLADKESSSTDEPKDKQGSFADKQGSSADKEGSLTDEEGSSADELKDKDGLIARAGPGEDSAGKMEPAVLPAVMPSRQTMFAQLR